jgi:hypothetical protein
MGDFSHIHGEREEREREREMDRERQGQRLPTIGKEAVAISSICLSVSGRSGTQGECGFEESRNVLFTT